MYIELDENNKLTGNYAIVGGGDDWTEVDSLPPSEPYEAYYYKNGKYILDEATAEEINKKRDAAPKIEEFKKYLADTDYVVLKIAEGVSSSEDYSDILKKRKEAREQINELQEL